MNVWGEGVRGKPLYLLLNFSVNLKTAIKNKVFNFLKVCYYHSYVLLYYDILTKTLQGSCIYPNHILTNEESDAQIC